MFCFCVHVYACVEFICGCSRSECDTNLGAAVRRTQCEALSVRFCYFPMSGLASFTPDPVAFKSFMNWIRVRTCVTSLRKTLNTHEVFHVLKDTPSFSHGQKEILRALQRIYESGKHKIYSVFASEDLCIALFHEHHHDTVHSEYSHGREQCTDLHSQRHCRSCVCHFHKFFAELLGFPFDRGRRKACL
jgi:hypothetical protein